MLQEKDGRLNWIAVLALVPLLILLVLIAILSLQWRMEVDSPIILYPAYLIDHFGYVPYRDFFDVQLPGTYFLYLLIGRFSNYTDFGYKVADLLFLSCIVTVLWLWMKNLGWKAASFGALVFGLLYLRGGRLLSMEREYLLLFPLGCAVLLSASLHRVDEVLRGFLVGMLFGLCATIKPAAVVGYPFVLFLLMANRKRNDSDSAGSFLSSRALLIVLSSVAGLALPVIVCIIYLWQVNALQNLVSIITNYYPLYSEISGDHEVLTGLARAKYLYNGYFAFGSYTLWFIPAVLGVYVALFHSTLSNAQKNQVLAMVGLTLSYSIYALLSFQFHPYHWLPFAYFLVTLGSLCLVGQPWTDQKIRRYFPIGVLLLTIFLGVRPPQEFYAQIAGQPLSPPLGGRVDEIASYLGSHMAVGDRVQPLDLTGGSIHAMLNVGAQIATPFLFDYEFYQNASSDYIAGLREEFIRDLDSSKPRFIIQIETNKPWISGPGTTRDFPELQSILDSNYVIGRRGDGYLIWVRSP